MPAVRTDLDVNHPNRVPHVLRAAADAYYASADELSHAWQSPAAGDIWNRLGAILERAADAAEKVLRRKGYD